MNEERILELTRLFPVPEDKKPTMHIGIVVHSALERDRLQKELDPDHRLFRVISNNQPIAGFRFATVLVSDFAHRHAYNMGRTARDRFVQWLNIDVANRCVSGGKVVMLP